tara:strand:+ start:92 stop:1048 length:957 start_codon:yes stop_codon:yes gene_type:complete
MPDTNVTFAGLPLRSPIVIEPSGTVLSSATARSAVEAGAGAVCLPPLDGERLNHRSDPDELTEHNLDDDGRRQSLRIVRKLNTQAYLDEVDRFASALEVPVIAPLQCERRGNWLAIAEQLREAGAAAIELRPQVEEMARTMRSDQIEKAIVRITASVAGRIDVPVIVRIPVGSLGSIGLVQALGDADAAAVAIRPLDTMRSFDLGGPTLRPTADDEAGQRAAFFSQLTACRALYRRVAPHLALRLPERHDAALTEALLAGATLGTLPVDGEDPRAAQDAVDRIQTTTDGWLRQHRMSSLFDARGLLSESRLTSSLENS